MVKVCHLTSAHNSDDDRIFYKECSSLASSGYMVFLIAPGESREENGVHVIGIGKAPNSRIKRMTTFANKVYLKALELNCDIYHFHDPELLSYGLKLKKHGKKVIFDSHENTAVQITEKTYIPKFARVIVSSIYWLRETAIIRKLDAVIVPCTFDGKNIFEGRAKKTIYIANYPRKELFSNQYEPSVKKVYDICYVGGISYDRGIYHLVKATRIGNFKLLLVGQFSSKEFEAQIRSMPEFNNVVYLGVVPNTEVAKTVQMSLAGCNTLLDVGQYYHIDTVGVKVFEYMSVGLPVIMNDCAYATKMIKKYECGICVNPENVDDIANAIRYLLQNPDEAKRMGDNGRRAIEQEYNWGIESKKLLALYESIGK